MGWQSHVQAMGHEHRTTPLPLGWGYSWAHPDSPNEKPPACKVLCPELTAAWAQHNSLSLKSQGWENNQAKILSAVWQKQPSPPSAESYRFAAPVCGPACNLFRLAKPGDCFNSLKLVYPASMICFNCLGLGILGEDSVCSFVFSIHVTELGTQTRLQGEAASAASSIGPSRTQYRQSH